MVHFIKALSARTEFLTVVVVAFGYFIISSLVTALSASTEPLLTNAGLQGLFWHELIVGSILAGFLYLRGWTWQQLGLTPTRRETLIGLALAALIYFVALMLAAILYSLNPHVDLDNAHLVAPGLNLLTVAAISLLNPLFEEVFVCGYVINALKKTRSLSFAINVSVGLRLAYHLYQGPAGLVFIIAFGLIVAYWFAKTGRLWPTVVAHAIFDFFSLVLSS